MITRQIKSLAARIRGSSDRARSIGTFFITSLGSRAIGVGAQLIQVSIAVTALGNEAFGLWMAFASFQFVINFADLGIGVGLQNKLAEAFARNDQRLARQLFATGFIAVFVIAMLLSAVLVPLVWCLDWSAAFRIEDPELQRQAAGGAVAVAFTLSLGFPFALSQRLAYACQLGWMHNISQAMQSVAYLIATWVGIRLNWSLGGLILATHSTFILANLGLVIVLFARLNWIGASGFQFRWDDAKQLLALGSHFCVQQILNVALYSLPTIIISSMFGAASVTPYNLTTRLFNLFAITQNAFMLPLWPAYSDAKARNERDWMLKALRRSCIATVFCTLIPMLMGAVVARPVIDAWTGGDAILPSAGLVWLLFVWNAVKFVQQPFGYLLSGVSEVNRLTVYSVISTVTCTLLMFLLGSRFGLEGVIAGLISGFVPFRLLGSMVETNRFLRRFGKGSDVLERVQPADVVAGTSG